MATTNTQYLAVETDPVDKAGLSPERPRQGLVRVVGVIYLATWEGDPGRTWVLGSARRFATELAATRALAKVRRQFPNRKYHQAHVRPVRVHLATVYHDTTPEALK